MKSRHLLLAAFLSLIGAGAWTAEKPRALGPAARHQKL
jgi:hypothetical protein